MYGVKRETGEDICRACFSTDRRLSPLANYDLFFGLLDDEQKLEALKFPPTRLCWECSASLRRMKLFQTQVKHAHRLLQELEGESVYELPTKGLSQLSTYYKQDYDVIIKEQFDSIEEQFLLPVKEETKVQTDIFNHNLDPDDDHCTVETEHLETHAELELIVERTENSLEETIPRTKYKRKLKRVETKSSLQNKIKRIKIETVPIQKGNRDNIPSLYPNRNNGNKKDFKNTKIKVSNTIKREFKQPKRLNRRDPTPIVKKKKENQTPDGRDTAGNDLQNEVTNDDKAEANTDSELENLHVQNTKEKIEIDIDYIEQNNHLDESNSENDNDANDDPNFEIKISTEIDDIEQNNHLDEIDSENYKGDNDDPDLEEKINNNDNNPSNSVKIKTKRVSSSDSWLRRVCIRFNITNQLDEYFTKVDLGPEEVKHVLDNELSYESEGHPYSCNYCGFCFQMTKTLLEHKRGRHKQIAKCANPVYLMYKCNICHKIVRKEHIEAHMKYLHRWRYYCKECDKDFWDKEEGRSHYREIHKQIQRLSCNHCRYVCGSRRGMEGHLRDCHSPVSCDVCGKTLTGALYLRNHKRRHLPDGTPPELRYCVPCDRQFVSVFAYKKHVNASTIHKKQEREKIPCTKCGRLMVDKRSLQAHYDRFHSDKTRFQCPHCDKYYSRQGGVNAHIRSVHLKKRYPKDKLCTICGRGFSAVRILTHHMRTHTGERPHACPHCPAAFAQPYPLKKHLATQHSEAPTAKHKGAPTTQASHKPS